MTILDYGLLIFLAITLIFGLKKGFAKMISTTICIIVALACSVVATIALLRIVKDTQAFVGLQNLAGSWFEQPYMTTEVTSKEHLAELLADAGVFSVLKRLSGAMYARFATFGVQTFGGFVGALIALIVVAFVLWLAIYLIFKYVLLAFKKLLCKMAQAPVLRSIDKIFGAILAVGVGYIVVFGVLYSVSAVVCAKFLPDIGAKVVSMANRSILFAYIHNTNILGQFICDLFNVNYLTFAPLA